MAKTYSPGFSKERAALARVMKLDNTNRFKQEKRDLIGRLQPKDMGAQNGVDPKEEVFSLTPVDFGNVEELGTGDTPLVSETQKGLDAAGNEVDISTLGSGMHNRLCGSKYAGSFAVGKDSYKPTFFRKSVRFPMFCVDELQTSTEEARATMKAIKNDGPDMVRSMLNYNLWPLLLERSMGNTAISLNPVFSQDYSAPQGSFAHLPQSHANHTFFKRIKEKTMRDPANWGKNFYVEMCEHQIQRAIEDDQTNKGIQRRSIEKVVNPYRVESTTYYDGIHYVARDSAEYVGTVQTGSGTHEIVRPHDFVHQAGGVYGTVARPNYALDEGNTILVNGSRLNKYEVAHWYYEDHISFVPFKQSGKVPTSGKESIKDNTYTSPLAFKPYWIKEAFVKDHDGNAVENDRGQFQQMAMQVIFGLFYRPDKIQGGMVLMAPAHEQIVLATPIVYAEDTAQPTLETLTPAEGSILNTNGELTTEGSTPLEGGPENPLSENPGANDPDPALASAEAGQFRFYNLAVEVVEGIDTKAIVKVIRVGGTSGAASLLLTDTDGTAADTTNFTANDETLSWAAGEGGTKTHEIDLIDADISADKVFTVVASSASGASAPTSATATVTIKKTPA